MKVLDLFAGLGGWSAPFLANGHEVCRVDIDARFELELVKDIFELQISDLPWRPDVILASPPCETFSVASIGHHWSGGSRAYEAKTKEAELGKRLVEKTVELIQTLQPRYAIIENPRGVLRKLNLIPVQPHTVWYCHFGETRAKPTDLWGLPFPSSINLRNSCHNRRANHLPECCCSDHEAAPRGARTGTQGLGSYAIKSVIPYQLANEVRLACEREGL